MDFLPYILILLGLISLGGAVWEVTLPAPNRSSYNPMLCRNNVNMFWWGIGGVVIIVVAIDMLTGSNFLRNLSP